MMQSSEEKLKKIMGALCYHMNKQNNLQRKYRIRLHKSSMDHVGYTSTISKIEESRKKKKSFMATLVDKFCS